MTKLQIPYSTYGFYYTAATRLGCVNIEFLDLLELQSEIKNKSPEVLNRLKAFIDAQEFKKEVSDHNWKIIIGESLENNFSKDYLDAREKCNNARLDLIKSIKDYRVKNNLESL